MKTSKGGLSLMQRPGRAGHNVLHRLLHIGIHDWRAPNAEGGGHSPSLAIRYAGVLG